MITVIIAGGSGTRLWPLSTSAKPKQLLSLAGKRTLVQQAYDRASVLGDKIYVLPEASHADQIRHQLPELNEENYIVEPMRRGTANCYMAALAHIAKRHDADEPIALISADHHIRDTAGFARSMRIAEKASRQYGRITLVGIEPTYPATGFGYIEKTELVDVENYVYGVKGFKEKPDHETATKFIESGRYVWNASYFVGSLATFLRCMKQYAPNLHATYEMLYAIEDPHSDEYAHAYSALAPDAIEYGLMEKLPDLLVAPASFDWMDIGNFKDLHDVVLKDDEGNYIYGDNIHKIESENAYIRNEEPGKPVAVIGLNNVVVVNTPDGLLVARKDIAAKCGDIAKKIQTEQEA